MKLIIESTTKVVDILVNYGESIPARIWEGETDTGIRVHCYITRVAVAEDQPRAQFEAELQACRAPSAAVEAIPLRMIL